ncbi:porin Omp33-36 [Acinetobacter sp.]|uniref:porin Omp33-36 n=1 Tax=Acinetobacter sp. TaxID=472 RepID=UPI0035B16697
MKKLGLASALLLAMTGAHAYQTEIKGQVEYFDDTMNNNNYTGSVQGTYYFKDVDSSKGPLAEAAFLNQASNVSAAYSFGQYTADVKVPAANINEEAEAQQHSYGIKAEAYIPTQVVPVYASASYNHSKTDAKNNFTANNPLNNENIAKLSDGNGDRYSLELGAVIAPNFLVAVGYTSVADQFAFDTFNNLSNGSVISALETGTIADDQDAITARTKYVGAIDGTNMSIGFEAGLVYGEDTLYQLKTDLYLTPKLSTGVSYTESSFKETPSTAWGLNANYFITPAVAVGVNYVNANAENSQRDTQTAGVNAKFRF